ncbi:MAG: hypothetical protein ACRELS_11120 [Candidatus Rokuibacteriota bacterium]
MMLVVGVVVQDLRLAQDPRDACFQGHDSPRCFVPRFLGGEMPDILFWIGVAMALVLGMAVIAFAVTQKRRASVLERLATALGGRVSRGRLAFVHGGTEYQVSCFVYPATRGEPNSGFRIRAGCRSRGSFCAVYASLKNLGWWLGRGWLWFGRAPIISTHDADFDQKVLLESKTADFAWALFSAPETRNEIRAIFALGFGRVRHDGAVVEATWLSSSSEPTEIDPSIVSGAASHLSILVDRIQARR